MALKTWKMIQPMANEIRLISGDDDAFFANLVMQVVHQIKYVTTENVQYPLVTISDGTGDCDNVATLAAALMKAGGLDTSVIIGPVPQGNCADYQNHAVAGVALDGSPDNSRTTEWIDYKNFDIGITKYWIAEATWNDELPKVTDYAHHDAQTGSLVGDNPLHLESSELVAKTPDEGCTTYFCLYNS